MTRHPDTGPVVELQDVTVQLGRRVVLAHLTLVVPPRETVVVAGANGSGKTTLLRALAGVVRPTAGRRRGPPRCAYVPAALTPPALDAGAWLEGVPRRQPLPRQAALAQLGFDGKLDRGCRTLSFGNLRKLVLAEALTSGEQLIVIDEASAGLDDRGLAGLGAIVAQRCAEGVAVVLADQDSQRSVPADRIVRLAAGAAHLLPDREDATAAGPVAVTVTLRGPSPRRDELVAVAARLGFHPPTASEVTEDPAP